MAPKRTPAQQLSMDCCRRTSSAASSSTTPIILLSLSRGRKADRTSRAVGGRLGPLTFLRPTTDPGRPEWTVSGQVLLYFVPILLIGQPIQGGLQKADVVAPHMLESDRDLGCNPTAS